MTNCQFTVKKPNRLSVQKMGIITTHTCLFALKTTSCPILRFICLFMLGNVMETSSFSVFSKTSSIFCRCTSSSISTLNKIQSFFFTNLRFSKNLIILSKSPLKTIRHAQRCVNKCSRTRFPLFLLPSQTLLEIDLRFFSEFWFYWSECNGPLKPVQPKNTFKFNSKLKVGCFFVSFLKNHF